MRAAARYGLACIGIAFLPWLVSVYGRTEPYATIAPPAWPKTFDGRSLTPIPLDQQEAQYAALFPGQVGMFHDGQRQLLLRWTNQPTRRLHPARHCFRGAGYSIRPHAPTADADGKIWGCFIAEKGKTRLLVQERIYSASASWTDVSAWYWSARLGRDQGPWWSVTSVETAPWPL